MLIPNSGYYTLHDAGVEITLASPKGGQPPLDPKNDEPDAQTQDAERFHTDRAAQQAALAATVRVDTLRAENFDALFYPDGHGPLWDLAEDPHAIALIEQTFANGWRSSAIRPGCCTMRKSPTAHRWWRVSV